MQHRTATPISLASFIRSRRLQAQPADFGFPDSGRRRTPGLRREELAQLCGISTTWLAWIEQGRTSSVSMPTLLALARGLKLTRAERTYLFQLAARADPAPQLEADSDQTLLRGLVDCLTAPAYVLDRYWDAIVWNAAAARLLPAWLGRQALQRTDHPNLLQYVFLEPAARRDVVDWKQRAQRLVAEFRADTAVARQDPLRESMVEELSARSIEFASAWRAERVCTSHLPRHPGSIRSSASSPRSHSGKSAVAHTAPPSSWSVPSRPI